MGPIRHHLPFENASLLYQGSAFNKGIFYGSTRRRLSSALVADRNIDIVRLTCIGTSMKRECIDYEWADVNTIS